MATSATATAAAMAHATATAPATLAADVAPADGIHQQVPRERCGPAVQRLRDAYAIVPGAPIYRCEFGYYCLDAWREQGLPKEIADEYWTPASRVCLNRLFGFDAPARHDLRRLGWCEAAFDPVWTTEVLEDRGEHELARDFAGRSVLFFKGRRNGFMPEYVDHPVKDLATWERDVIWRLDPTTPERWKGFSDEVERAKAAAAAGRHVNLGVIGCYMFLRSLIGPSETLYVFHDAPELVHACMRQWLVLADAVATRWQEHLTLDEVFFAEDICYNKGPLVSPKMIREFLFPYYREFLQGVRRRQIDRSRKLHIQVDTDGDAVSVTDLYREIGCTMMSPCEVASGCDVVAIGKRWPDLALLGGIDKRILAAGKDAIDRELERIMPVMRARGGYIPTCDHGVPAEVKYEDYLHYRKRMLDYCG